MKEERGTREELSDYPENLAASFVPALDLEDSKFLDELFLFGLRKICSSL